MRLIGSSWPNKAGTISSRFGRLPPSPGPQDERRGDSLGWCDRRSPAPTHPAALYRALVVLLALLVASFAIGLATTRDTNTARRRRPVPTTITTTTTFRSTPSTPPPPPMPVVAARASRGAPRTNIAQDRAATPEERAEAITEICSYDWPCDLAVKVASCESGLRWWRTNSRSSARGIFQILHGPLDLKLGVSLAYSLWSQTRDFWARWRWSAACWR